MTERAPGAAEPADTGFNVSPIKAVPTEAETDDASREAAISAVAPRAAESPPESPLGPGERLGQARVAAGLSLDDVARALRFAPRQISALERGDYAALPGVAVVRGIVRSYARLLKLDPVPLLENLAGRLEAPDADRLADRYNEPVPFSNPGKRSNTVYAVLSVLVLLAAAAVWYEWRHNAPVEARMTFVPAAQAPLEPPKTTVASAATAPVIERPVDGPAGAPGLATMPAVTTTGDSAATPDAPVAQPALDAVAGPPRPAPVEAGERDSTSVAPVASAVPAASGVPPKPVTVAAAASTGGRIDFRFARDSWVEVRDGDDKVVLSRLNPAGSETTVEGRPPFTLVIGNAQFVEVRYNGRRIDLEPHIRVAVGRLTLE